MPVNLISRVPWLDSTSGKTFVDGAIRDRNVNAIVLTKKQRLVTLDFPEFTLSSPHIFLSTSLCVCHNFFFIYVIIPVIAMSLGFVCIICMYLPKSV